MLHFPHEFYYIQFTQAVKASYCYLPDVSNTSDMRVLTKFVMSSCSKRPAVFISWEFPRNRQNEVTKNFLVNFLRYTVLSDSLSRVWLIWIDVFPPISASNCILVLCKQSVFLRDGVKIDEFLLPRPVQMNIDWQQEVQLVCLLAKRGFRHFKESTISSTYGIFQDASLCFPSPCNFH